MSEQSDFNSFVCSSYWHKATLIASRFTDLDCKDWERLSCEWHVRYQYGNRQDPQDVYYVGNMERRHSVDALIEKPEISAQAEIMCQAWTFEKKRLADNRKEPPPVVILPPEPEPKPLPVPTPTPEVPKQNPAPWLVKASVYLGLASPLVLLASGLLPPPFNLIFKAVWPVLLSLLNQLTQ